jgi:CheY-like chemotaxis protein
MGEAQPLSRHSNRALIVVVERDEHVQRLERYFLEQAGYEVAFAASGEQALEMARELEPRILITEILLPGTDGLSLCRQLKADAATREIAVLVFSILAAEDRAREAGADAFLRKPLDDALLVGTVERLIARYREGVAGVEGVDRHETR